MVFLKEDLLHHYSWTNKAGPTLFTGDASRRLFDPFNGDQMLFMINLYGSLNQKFSVEDGQRIEKLIKESLPDDVKSEVSVLDWLK